MCPPASASRSGYRDAVLRAGGDVEVIDVAAGLADELELRQLLDCLAGERYALLDEHQRIAARYLLDDAVLIGIGIGVDDDFMAFQLRKCLGLAEGIGVVVYD